MAEVKVTVYLPLKDNDGTDLAEAIMRFEDEMYAAFGTHSHVGYAKGAWRMQTGQKAFDTSAIYSIVIEAGRVPEVREIARHFKAKTRQECIYFEIQRNTDVEYL